MRNLLVVASGVLILSHATAQQGTAQPGTAQEGVAKLVALRDAKLDSPFLKRVPWTTDFAAARSAATTKNLPILIYFTRSYAASPPCAVIEEQLFTTEEFGKLAPRVILFCHITSKVEADKHQDLLARFGGDSFPHMVFADAAGNRIAGVDRISSVKDIAEVLDGAVGAFLKIRARAAAGDKKAKAAYFIRRLQLGHLGPKAIEKELKIADYLTTKQRGAIQRSLASLEVMEIMASVDEKRPESLRSAAERMLIMMRAGRVPSGRLAFPFWQVLIGHADQTEDPVLFETALRSLKKLTGGVLDKKWLTKMELKLRLLRHMKGRKKRGR